MMSLNMSSPIWLQVWVQRPFFQRHFKEDYGYDIDESERHRVGTSRRVDGEAARERTRIVFPDHTCSWNDIAFLKEHWDEPIILKGIQTVRDAKKCVKFGVLRHCHLG